MAQETALYRDDVEQVRRRFAEWRNTHDGAIPAAGRAVDCTAVELVQRDGIDATSRALDVDKQSLRKWAGRLHPAPQPARGKSRPKRREKMLTSSSGAATSCLVEVESPQGAKLRLEWKGIPTSELAKLVRAFATT